MAHMADWQLPPFEDTPEWWAEHRRWRQAYNTCAECDSTNVRVENHDPIWRDGDVMCENGHRVRTYDAG